MKVSKPAMVDRRDTWRFITKALCRILWYSSWGLLFLDVFTFFLVIIAAVLLSIQNFKIEALSLIKLGCVFSLPGLLIAFLGMLICCLADPGKGLNSLRHMIFRLGRRGADSL
ncbi:hypothetical protein MOMUL_29270 [Moorella mulderi DSM 14980]|uniref:Uncharacterized protein n=1 Tax=Moorella mulderi DSM 14980 TaxID=1122241 RepID=A0A151ASX0_9FIRM|nr:hypothetical protein MOMUL_29270 [Moorella mulderi DSM 14980]